METGRFVAPFVGKRQEAETAGKQRHGQLSGIGYGIRLRRLLLGRHPRAARKPNRTAPCRAVGEQYGETVGGREFHTHTHPVVVRVVCVPGNQKERGLPLGTTTAARATNDGRGIPTESIPSSLPPSSRMSWGRSGEVAAARVEPACAAQQLARVQSAERRRGARKHEATQSDTQRSGGRTGKRKATEHFTHLSVVAAAAVVIHDDDDDGGCQWRTDGGNRRQQGKPPGAIAS